MKRLMRFVTLGLLVLAAGLTGCSTVQPDAGHEAVLVRKPLLFGSGGVDPTPVRTGLKYIAFTTSSVDVNMQPRRVDSEFDDLMTSDGVPIDFHSVITYQVTDSVKLIRDFGGDIAGNGVPGFWTRNLDQPYRLAAQELRRPICGTRVDGQDFEVAVHSLRLHAAEYLRELGTRVEGRDQKSDARPTHLSRARGRPPGGRSEPGIG